MTNEKDTLKEKTFDEIDRYIVADCIDDARYVMFSVGIQESDDIKADVKKTISKLEGVVNIDDSGFCYKTIRMLEMFLVNCSSEALDVSEKIGKFIDELKSTWGEADGKR